MQLQFLFLLTVLLSFIAQPANFLSFMPGYIMFPQSETFHTFLLLNLLHQKTEGFHILIRVHTWRYTVHTACEQHSTHSLDFLHKNDSKIQIWQHTKYMYVTYRVDAWVGINLQSVNVITWILKETIVRIEHFVWQQVQPFPKHRHMVTCYTRELKHSWICGQHWKNMPVGRPHHC